MAKVECIGHILIFPYPAQGHVNSMLKLAHLLDLANFHITFFVSSNIHARLLALTDVDSGRFSPRFRLQSFPPGIYDGGIDSKEGALELYHSLHTIGKPFLKQYIAQNRDSGLPFTCFISDLVLSIALEVSEQSFNLPVYYFCVISACGFWAYFSLPDLFEAGELPIKENGLESSITKVKGMEDFLRARDLPSCCRYEEEGPTRIIYTETRRAVKARALILNTFEDLEGPILSQIRTKCPKVYTIGPLHARVKATLASKSTHSNSLLQEDETCMAWLDSQEPKSVIYVSFGSISVLTRQQLMEFWYGLVNSGKKFLWVMRPDLVAGKDEETPIPSELEEGTKANGYIIGWAPQEAVLDHPAVGGFLTHSGWNSTLESIAAGVPMICWPFFADQQTNSRFVGEVWKLGMDMKDVCDRSSVEKLIRELMEKRKGEFLERAENMVKLAKEAISEGGSSYCNFDCLIQDIIKLNESMSEEDTVKCAG
ncbi:7-deoxyloganetic acid glucosyltransferase-like [Ipomoea triloba]|uniref:7-deoxyloganetic acid glucosyltransferase-like n=1 Tax=Ipomoea triloba TaxID=35885 RepID=UPI00125DA318|nr:7-deoxyloganetic acid glucosyltransferase-like [Ipomoea triloba]